MTVTGFEKEHGAIAAVRMNEYDQIEMVFDTRASGRDLLIAMAHEMIHVRQLAYAELYYDDEIAYWYGKPVFGKTYEELPWEVEAYDKMVDLLRQVPVNQPVSSLLN